MFFEMIGPLASIEPIAIGTHIRDLERLRKAYRAGRWRKLKGIATVRLADSTVWQAELHWYEAHGIGRKELKIKHLLAQD